jgi:hypothetical protein
MRVLIFLAITLAASFVQAQQSAPCLKLSQVKVEHRVLHQDSTMRIKLKFEAQKFAGKKCYVFTESPALGKQMPTLEVQNEQSLTAHVGAVEVSRLDLSTVGASIIKAQEISTIVTVSASPDATLGERKLAGTVRYKIIDSQGNIADESLSFDLPIKVEPARTFSKPPGFAERHPVWTKTVVWPLAIVGAIVLLPIFILAEIMGLDPD